MLGVVLDGHSDSEEMVGQAATAAGMDQKLQCESTSRPVSLGGGSGQWGMGGLGCFHCMEGMVQRNIQNPARREGKRCLDLVFSRYFNAWCLQNQQESALKITFGIFQTSKLQLSYKHTHPGTLGL